jgi:hypothetical protein
MTDGVFDTASSIIEPRNWPIVSEAVELVLYHLEKGTVIGIRVLGGF